MISLAILSIVSLPHYAQTPSAAVIIRIEGAYREVWKYSSRELPQLLMRESKSEDLSSEGLLAAIVVNKSRTNFAIFDSGLSESTVYFRARIFDSVNRLKYQRWAIATGPTKVVAGFDAKNDLTFEFKNVDMKWHSWSQSVGRSKPMETSQIYMTSAFESSSLSQQYAYLLDLEPKREYMPVLDQSLNAIARKTDRALEALRSNASQKIVAPGVSTIVRVVHINDARFYVICAETAKTATFSSENSQARLGLYYADLSKNLIYRICDAANIGLLSNGEEPLIFE